jgi:hypothetical protein
MRALTPLLPLLLAALPVHGQEEPPKTVSAAVRLVETRSREARPQVLFPQIELRLVAERPEDLEGVPELSDRARYAVAAVGGTKTPLAFDAPEGSTALGRLHIPGDRTRLGHARAAGGDGFRIAFDGVLCGALEVDIALHYRGIELMGALLMPVKHRRGTTLLEGARRTVILVDADADGRFDGPTDRWVALKDARMRSAVALRRTEAQLLTEPQIPFLEDGRALMVDGITPDGANLRLVLGPPRVPQREVLARRYAEVRAEYFRRFEQERDGFEARKRLDPRRPRSKSPATWRTMSLTEGKALAQREGRPLLVHYFRESNAWCYRLEFYSFPDREVDALLRRFVLVAVDVDKDPEHSYEQAGARGIPALVPFTRNGRRVAFRLRALEEDGKVRDLGTEKESMITGWQRPQELIVNLERILDRAG